MLAQQYDASADGWEIESLQRAWAQVNPEIKGATFSEGDAKVWFAIIRRKA